MIKFMMVKIVKIPDIDVWFKDLLNKEIEVKDRENSSYYDIIGSNNIISKEYCEIINL